MTGLEEESECRCLGLAVFQILWEPSPVVLCYRDTCTQQSNKAGFSALRDDAPQWHWSFASFQEMQMVP